MLKYILMILIAIGVSYVNMKLNQTPVHETQIVTKYDNTIAYTDGVDIYIGKTFSDSLSDNERHMVITHERGHIKYNHVNRHNQIVLTKLTKCMESYTKTYCIDQVKNDVELLAIDRDQETEADGYAFKQLKSEGVDSSVCEFFTQYFNSDSEDITYEDHPSFHDRYNHCKSILD